MKLKEGFYKPTVFLHTFYVYIMPRSDLSEAKRSPVLMCCGYCGARIIIKSSGKNLYARNSFTPK